MTIWMTLALVACNGDTTGDSGTDSDSGTTGVDVPDFFLMADDLDSGMLLASWSDGDTMISVGGDLGSGPGTLTRYADGELCIEADVHDRGLWWIHGPSDGEWYAVGFEGRILHSVDGEIWQRVDGTWSLHTGGLPGALFKVWDGWIVGDDQIYQWDGDTWVSHDTVWLLDDDTGELYEETVASDLAQA